MAQCLRCSIYPERATQLSGHKFFSSTLTFYRKFLPFNKNRTVRRYKPWNPLRFLFSNLNFQCPLKSISKKKKKKNFTPTNHLFNHLLVTSMSPSSYWHSKLLNKMGFLLQQWGRNDVVILHSILLRGILYLYCNGHVNGKPNKNVRRGLSIPRVHHCSADRQSFHNIGCRLCTQFTLICSHL